MQALLRDEEITEDKLIQISWQPGTVMDVGLQLCLALVCGGLWDGEMVAVAFNNYQVSPSTRHLTMWINNNIPFCEFQW
jgi:hypothetical protein